MEDRLAARLGRVRRLARAMNPSTKPVDEVLPLVRALLAEAGVVYRFVGGVSVVHHGYVRTTQDIDVLVRPDAAAALDPLLEKHGFERVSPHKIRHVATGVPVDFLVAGETLPRPLAKPFPDPASTTVSTDDESVIGLAVLFELKLRAGRLRDQADVLELLKRVDDAHYIPLEAAVSAELRPTLARLRDDALEEARFEDGD